MTIAESSDPTGGLSGRLRSLGTRPWIIAALLAVILVSIVLHIWGLRGDLPYPPDVDEPIFMNAAVRVASRGSLDPGWVGHPGSTVIYPLAAIIRVWDVLFEHGPLLARRDPGLTRLLATDPEPFYILGRLVSAAYGVASVAVSWLIARRLVSDPAALLAPALLAVTAIAVAHGQLLRTDTAGMFWSLVTVWLILRATRSGRASAWGFAAIALGMAISSRYFFVGLAAPYVVGLVLSEESHRGDLRRGALLGVGGLAIAGAVFAVTSPYVFLDLPRTFSQLRFEARSVQPGADGLSPIGNLGWYVGTVLPQTLGLVGIAASVIGGIAAWRVRPRATAVLLAFAAAYLVAISASPLHWARYVIVLVPIAGAFAAVAVSELARLGMARSRRRSEEGGPRTGPHRRLRGATVALVITVAVTALLAPGFAATVAADRLRAGPSTRVEATRWVASRIPPQSSIAEEMYGPYLTDASFRLKRVFSLSGESLADYRAQGWRYLIASSAISSRFDPGRYPAESAFYAELESSAKRIATFVPDAIHGGPTITVYELPAD